MILLPENVNLSIEQVLVNNILTVTLRSGGCTALCPSCGQVAKRVHSRYRRKPSDLPISGRPVRLVLELHRFFCDNTSCPRKTFAEQLPTLVRAHAQRTVRLQVTLQQLGLALGGEAGAQLGQQMGLQVSPDSLLRLVRQAEHSRKEPAKIIGIDDWAYKRRLRYGTLICDLEHNTPIDLLPDRSVQTVCTWLEQHPEVEIISRDRWSEYATAAQKGAPQAIQVADRWHLLNNLVEELTHLLARHRSQVRQQTGSSLQDNPQAASAPVTHRQDQYTQIQALHQLGLVPAQIASRVGLSERTVYRWLARQAAPHGRHQVRSASVMDPYKAYVLKRWQEGCRKGSQLCQELKAQGYRGSQRAVYRYLSFLQETPLLAEQSTSTAPQWEAFSAKQAVWLLIRQPEELNEQQRQALVGLCQVSPEIEQAYQLAQSFCSLLRHRQGAERLEGWLQDAKQSALPELQHFAVGIQRDKAAVQAGLSLPYSNGPVEGHITRLKLIKRSMYGRARFDLLRQRVLRAS
ncbi:MAG TPA: ISL3 family transposase [Ktedonobacteraceae bacterium]